MKEDSNPYETKSLSPALPLHESSSTFPRHAVLGSLLVMLPWPILGIAACLSLSLFDTSGEAVFMFGGVTVILLLPLALVVSEEWVFGVLIGVVWLSVLALPHFLASKSIHARFHPRSSFSANRYLRPCKPGLGF